jgi:hypothetical protein
LSRRIGPDSGFQVAASQQLIRLRRFGTQNRQQGADFAFARVRMPLPQWLAII